MKTKLYHSRCRTTEQIWWEDKPGAILDYDARGNVVSLDVRDASMRIVQAKQMTFELTST